MYYNYTMSAPKGLTIRANDQIVANVYDNIIEEFLSYRGLTMVSEKLADFGQEIFSKGKVIIQTADKEGKKVYIVLYHFIVSENLKAADVKKLVSKLDPESELILITQNQVSTHIMNFIKESPIQIHAYTYCNFIICVPKHQLVPEYVVLTQEEQEEVISTLRTKKYMLPKIKKSDPCVVWSTGKQGDIIKFTRNDEVVGKSVYYRVIV